MAKRGGFRQRDVRRSGATRTPRDRILVVVEGRCTEKNYFCDLRRIEKLASLVVVLSSTQSDPVGIVDYAKKVIERGTETIEPRSFEYVYTVFDHDGREEQYREALELMQRSDGAYRTQDHSPIHFTAFPSIPCFELWFLLHFEEIHPHEMHQKEVLKRLKSVWPDYEKNLEGTYLKTKEKLEEAIRHSVRLRQRGTGCDAVTHADFLVRKLLK